MAELSREAYAALYGPTVGDQARLGDTDLWIEITEDRTAGGEEAVFGGGKSIRESMAQGTTTRAEGAPDTVITNAIVLDHWGVVRADVGLRDGRIVGLGRAGNPDIADGVHPRLHIGPSTDVVAGEGRILTAGGIDMHVHFLSTSQVHEALAAGLTTLGGGGTGPSAGSKATTVTPGAWHLAQVLRGLDHLPINLLLMGKGNTVSAEGLAEQARAGAAAYKLHEDWGSTPAAIDAALRAADEHGLQVALHSDSLNEAGYVESTLRAIGGRTIHAFHTEGAGGGHAPDIMSIASRPNILPGSTNPTLPHTVNTVAEHLDMLIVCHHLNAAVPEDLAFAESRIRATTIAAEGLLHDLGALSMTSSDAQAMGRIGEVVTRTWQVAHVMKDRYGPLSDNEPADNERARRYVAKYTINPAIAHGIDHLVGSIEVGKLADLVLWDPRFFGVRPDVVLKGGAIAWAALGDPNASIPTPQPVLMRPALVTSAAPHLGITFVSPAAVESDLQRRLGVDRPFRAVRPTREVTKADMVNNGATPDIRIDPESFAIEVDGELVEPRPVAELPLAQRYTSFRRAVPTVSLPWVGDEGRMRLPGDPVTRLVVRTGPGGVRVAHATGLLAPRVLSTGPDTARVALVATTALLLGGDELTLEVRVGAGAGLNLHDVAATVAYDGRGRSCSWRADVVVEEDAWLAWHGEPFVVADGAETERVLTVDSAAGSRVLLRDTLVLGRHGETGGAVRTRTRCTHEGRPLLVEELDLRDARDGSGGPRRSPGVLGAARVVDQVMLLGDRLPADAHAAGDARTGAVRLDLAGPGTLVRHLGTEAHHSPLRCSYTAALARMRRAG